MKLFLTFAAVIAVAVAVPLDVVSPALAGAATIVEDVDHVPISPVIVNPVVPEPIAVGPAVIDTIVPVPVVVGPEIVDSVFVPEPIAVGPEIVDSAIVNPAPAVVEPAQPAGPLVQIIINVNAANAPSPALVPEDRPEPIIIVDETDNQEEIKPEPEIVVDPVIPEPVIVAEPIIVEPVIVGTPIIPSPAVTLPEDLN